MRCHAPEKLHICGPKQLLHHLFEPRMRDHGDVCGIIVRLEHILLPLLLVGSEACGSRRLRVSHQPIPRRFGLVKLRLRQGAIDRDGPRALILLQLLWCQHISELLHQGFLKGF
jgi:hypothetical protein